MRGSKATPTEHSSSRRLYALAYYSTIKKPEVGRTVKATIGKKNSEMQSGTTNHRLKRAPTTTIGATHHHRASSDTRSIALKPSAANRSLTRLAGDSTARSKPKATPPQQARFTIQATTQIASRTRRGSPGGIHLRTHSHASGVGRRFCDSTTH